MTSPTQRTFALRTLRHCAGVLVLGILWAFGSATTARAGLTGSFLYNLAGFTGPILFSGVRVAVDEKTREVYVCDPTQGSVILLNEQGMEVFRFGDDERLGQVYDVAVQDDGTILLLSYFPSERGLNDRDFSIVRCNFRGEPVGRIEVTGLPEGFEGFGPSRLVLRDGVIYLASEGSMRVVAADGQGCVQRSWNLPALLEMTEQEVGDTGLGGFAVAADGSLLFTVPATAKAYRLPPAGALESFGRRGSAPGRFGVINGIGADAQGTVYVVDTLRCVVLAFDRALKFVTEFGRRGLGPGGLVAPFGLAVASWGRVYVSQNARRGVSVFQVAVN
ncbi:MAG: hypothetical protein HY900_21400 [Deltaproteobacteria bacterium]|nr:hypothetical protein [Deltaproteobacteria bacterium]